MAEVSISRLEDGASVEDEENHSPRQLDEWNDKLRQIEQDRRRGTSNNAETLQQRGTHAKPHPNHVETEAYCTVIFM